MLNKNCNKNLSGGSLASDMVMSNVRSQNNKPYDFIPLVSSGDISSYKGINQTAGNLAKNLIKRHKKIMKKSKSTKSKSTKSKSTKSKSSKSSKSKSSKSKSKPSCISNSKKFKSKIHKNSLKGGGSDWSMSQYSQGPINDNSDLSKFFSSSSPSSKDSLRNPSNLGSAGSENTKDFYGKGYPL